MAKALKEMMVREYEEALDGEDSVLIVDFGNMTVETVQAFRRDLREKAGGAIAQLVHNRTARQALSKGLFSDDPAVLAGVLRGPSAIVYGGDGAIPIAKVVREWRRKQKDMRLKGGVAYGEVLGDEDLEHLADLPGVPQLRAMMLSAILGPARGIAGSLQAVYGGIARALKARIDKESGGGEASESGG
jgi:large subunit ribosomal protein L10